MDATELRAAFTRFFTDRGHVAVPSAGLIPQHPRAPLFTNAGMNQFIPYYLQEERPTYRRATSVQKCVRIRGKHDDIDLIGRTPWHLTFFEMLGNFSFGDYFKETAIPLAWELLTEVVGFEAERLWVTVHDDDDDAAAIWRDAVGLPADRLQRMGEDNFWEMGETGPCGPCSEIYYDRGPAWGEGGGPAAGDPRRIVEIWNLVFPQFDRQADGTLAPLPEPGIDTGAGLERVLAVRNGLTSVWETDLLRPLIVRAAELCGRTYGDDDEADVWLRVLADHSRAMTMLVADGVLPSNDGRGYVLRRIIRRAVLRARRLGRAEPVTPALADAVVQGLGTAYPELKAALGLVVEVLEREERGFDRTVRAGLSMLAESLDQHRQLPGDVAFRLHDTHGFPIELTEELAAEAGVAVDRVGFDAAMAEQRARARQAARAPAAADEDAYRHLLETGGPTDFVGRTSYAVAARVLGVLAGPDADMAEVFLDRTPFYSEAGGQVGDRGTIVTETGTATVLDAVAALPGLTAHRARIEGEVLTGQDAVATIDAKRREAVRRNHTGTHLLHAALRKVLGDHVRQQGSLVAPDRLRFDFSHPGQPRREELAEVVAIANGDVLTDAGVETVETTRTEAEQMGALSFFGDKYGEVVRVVRAGPHSLEFCGGTHVAALGQIGPITVVSEGSIGSNTRRIEAVTGLAAVARSARREATVGEVAELLRTEPDGVLPALQRLLDRQRSADKELARLRASAMEADAAGLAGGAGAAGGEGGVVVARRDGRAPDELRALAVAVRRRPGVRAVALGGSPGEGKVALVVATGGEPDAAAVAKRAAALVGGGGGGSADVAVAGGRDPGRIDDALDEARRALLGQ